MFMYTPNFILVMGTTYHAYYPVSGYWFTNLQFLFFKLKYVYFLDFATRLKMLYFQKFKE